MCRKAREKADEQLAWERWLAILPLMHLPEKGFVPGIKFVSFNDYYGNFKQPTIKTIRPAEEILDESKEIRQKLGKGW